MKFMIGGQGWPVNGGAWLISAGTLVGDGGIPLAVLPSPLPIDCISLDSAAWSAMQQWYAYSPSTQVDQRYRLLKGPGV